MQLQYREFVPPKAQSTNPRVNESPGHVCNGYVRSFVVSMDAMCGDCRVNVDPVGRWRDKNQYHIDDESVGLSEGAEDASAT